MIMLILLVFMLWRFWFGIGLIVFGVSNLLFGLKVIKLINLGVLVLKDKFELLILNFCLIGFNGLLIF